MKGKTMLLAGAGAGAVLLLVAALGTSAIDRSAAIGDELSKGESRKFTQKVGANNYEGSEWPPVGNQDLVMVWPAGKPAEWISYIHNRDTNGRALHRKANNLPAATYAQLMKDFGVQVASPWGMV